MIKFIIPAVLIFLTVLFWDKITEFFLKKFNIKVNFIAISIFISVICIIIALLYF